MPATYCKLHYHAIFSTKDRYPLITKDWRDNLHAYRGGIVKNLGSVPWQSPESKIMYTC
jgi:hypothetical protein